MQPCPITLSSSSPLLLLPAASQETSLSSPLPNTGGVSFSPLAIALNSGPQHKVSINMAGVIDLYRFPSCICKKDLILFLSYMGNLTLINMYLRITNPLVHSKRKRRLLQVHRCMESTPSIACANKCVFCWRWVNTHSKNMIRLFRSNTHSKNMIRQFRGNCKNTFWDHCTLSLVGEPIIYLKMNAFLYLLHTHRFSSFIVTDAQFPQEIRWGLLTKLITKQRTLGLNTSLCNWILDFLAGHPQVVRVGNNTSAIASLTMTNVPWHEEVIHFVQQLADMLPNYQITCKHEHSYCLLIVHTKVGTTGHFSYASWLMFWSLLNAGGAFTLVVA
uniref:tRNA wybutosine-synthesis domain-containing protein n=1 Tax=Salmo trutta TaxID=8032 RepID=A0A674F0K6_SALTR